MRRRARTGPPRSSDGALVSDPERAFDAEIDIDVTALAPLVTWGTRPDMVEPVTGRVPDPAAATSDGDARAMERALAYMGLTPGTAIEGVPVDRVFIGSCTNARLEDLRAAASVARGHHVNPRVRALVVPGSQQVKADAEARRPRSRSSPRPASNGASRAARCASA